MGGNVIPETEERSTETANHLDQEKSPYLIQHAFNPVDWYPWRREAFEKAKKEDKPIFLSIGYATCHWCHVMAHESFEDEAIAQILNKHYVSIKVDREERPDIDMIYMSACQALTGHGGWPLSVFMTPAQEPFFAGTYFPKMSRMGMPGFMDILIQIAELWQRDRQRILTASNDVMNIIRPRKSRSQDHELDLGEILKNGFIHLSSQFDKMHGGFGERPKFPTPHNLTFLLRYYNRTNDSTALSMVEKSLVSMRNGGIFDHIGFGFHRYSVDEKWMVPHFEKMLYDQALLAMAYTEAYQVTGQERYADTVREIFTYVLRDMVSPEGGFFSAEDADSEGEEGLFYIWTLDDIMEQLGKNEGEIFSQYFDIRREGNFERGYNIPNIPLDSKSFSYQVNLDTETVEDILKRSREQLFEIREKRIHPLKDDKVLVAWNGLMIAALSKGYMALGNKAYLEAAMDAVFFILNNLKDHGGRLLRRYRKEESSYAGYLEDYAFFVWGLIELYEASFDPEYLREALSLNQDMIKFFWDNEDKGFFFTGEGNESLITRHKDIYDTALPSGNSVAAFNLLRLGRMTGNPSLELMSEEIFKAFSRQIHDAPIAYTQLLSAIDFMVGPSMEIVIAGNPDEEGTRDIINLVRKHFKPNKVLLLKAPGKGEDELVNLSPFLKDMNSINDMPTVYICEQYACKKPITTMDELKGVL